MDPAIVTSDLTKRYGRIVAVDRLTIEVERGEIFGFLGPNGAGKTTTMRMLLGLVKPTSGGARMLGLDVARELPRILSKTSAIIENPTFYPFLSGFENLRLVARLTDTSDSRIAEVLDLVDLSGDANRAFKKYSLGMKQRLAVASCLLSNPDLLILDEPANGLDPAGIVEMRTLMKQLKEQGHTVFVSSHVLHEIEQICDRVAILNHGKVVVQGRVDVLLGSQAQIEVAVAPEDRAREVLAALSWVGGVTSRDGKLVVSAPVDRSADVNRALAEAGLYASEVRPGMESLERYFLDVTGGAAA
ncbi:MAG TPA: ABC transporter ATP-binding protein [Chloroflexota bacterium]|nr:ABC transporter ATP-binding protein [Chloroflexota bacterium]